MRRFNSATLIAAAAADIYRKWLLISVPISHRSLSAAAGIGKTYKWKRLPAELSALEHVAELTCKSAARGGVCNVYLIGTAHCTQKSNEEVKALIEFVKPQVVFLELCHSRAYMLNPVTPSPRRGEYYVANEEALKYGAKVVLGDRNINITLQRFRIMPYLWELLVSRLKAINIVRKGLFVKDELRVSHLERELRRHAPSFYETIIHERDQYMSVKLLKVAWKHNSVVAVVGKDHLLGIQKYWKKPVDMEQMEQLRKAPHQIEGGSESSNIVL